MTTICPDTSLPAVLETKRVKGRTWRFQFTLRAVVVTQNPDGSTTYTAGAAYDLTGNVYQATIYLPFNQAPLTMAMDPSSDLPNGVIAFKLPPTASTAFVVEDPGEPPQTRIEVDQTSGSDIDTVAIVPIRVIDPANAASASGFNVVIPSAPITPSSP